jgi:bidirectional [NiFe] hydrogenase diaphorase subunit
VVQAQHRPETTKHPSGDKRFEMLDTSMKRLRFMPDALIEVLHTAQELFGHLRPDILLYVARALKLPPSRVYGVATFYSYFTLKPPGEHACVVCMGTACYINGAPKLLGSIVDDLGIGAGATTSDGKVSLLTAHCVGACSVAPVVVLDGEVHGKATAESVMQAVRGL